MEWGPCHINSAYKSDTLNQICIGIKFSDVSYKIFGRLGSSEYQSHLISRSRREKPFPGLKIRAEDLKKNI